MGDWSGERWVGASVMGTPSPLRILIELARFMALEVAAADA